MHYFDKIIVALSLDPVDRDVLRYARLLVELGQGAPHVTFVHVLPDWSRHDAPPRSLGAARAAIEGAVREYAAGIEHAEVLVLSGAHLDKLLECTAELGADLLVVGHRRNASGRRSLSRRLAMQAPCSVWMVPEGTPARIGTVLAAVDFSQPAAHALSLATLIASRAGQAQCAALHVIEPQFVALDAADRDRLQREFDDFLAPLDLHGVAVRQRFEESGSVAHALDRHAQALDAGLLVIGTRGRGRSAAVLLGSQSEQVLLESTRPVLVTKRRGERLGLVQALFDREFRASGPQFG